MRVKNNLLAWFFIVNLIGCWAYGKSEFAQLQELLKRQAKQIDQLTQQATQQQRTDQERQLQINQLTQQVEQQQRTDQERQIQINELTKQVDLAAMATGIIVIDS